jgi:tripartite-type tricarboxylate transporter receptor subunit TctC
LTRALALLLAALASAHLASTTHAQQYPVKPVRIIVTNAPGVANDTIGRGISQFLGPKTGQPFIIDNRVGGEGVIGMEACANAAPDGHTYCISAQGAIILNGLIRSKLPYDPLKAFAPVAHLGYSDSGLTVPASFPARSFRELVEIAKKKPESVTWGVFSFTSTGNFYAEWLKRQHGVPFYVVPFKTPPQLLQALLNGEVQVGVYTPLSGLAPMVAAGKVRVLAATSDERDPAWPDVPTFQELGVKLPLRTWFGLLTQAAVPRDIVRWMNAEYNALAVNPEFRAKFLAPNGIAFVANTPEQFAATIESTRAGFVELLKIVPVKPQ